MARARQELPWTERRGGTYYAFWYDPTDRRTKRLSLRTSDPATAQTRFSTFLAEGAGTLFNTGSEGLTVHQALDSYFKEHVETKVTDVARQRVAISHLKAFFKTMPLKDVDVPACRGYAAARRKGVIGSGRGVRPRLDGTTKISANKAGSDATIRRELHVLVAAANHAEQWKRITHSDMPTFELPVERSAGKAPWLTRQELARVIRSTQRGSRLRDFIRLAYRTGSRRKAIETLTWKQVDLTHSRIDLAKHGERQTTKRRPVVPLFCEVRRLLERRLAGGGQYVFGDQIDIYREFNAHLVGLGMAHKANPHILRHSRATHLLQAGASIYDVARLLGDTVATVERVYGHHAPEFMADIGKRRRA